MDVTSRYSAETKRLDCGNSVKILITTGIYPPDIGGPATFTEAFTRWLESHGHIWRVITLWDRKKFEANLTNLFFPRSRIRILRFISVSRSVFKQLTNSDFLLATGLHEEAAVALRFKKKKSIARIVGDPVWERATNSNRTDLSLVDFQNSKLDLKSKLQRKLLVWSLNQYSTIMCPSIELCELVENWGVIRPLRFIPNGIKILEPEHTLKIYDLIVVSRLVKWKNVDQVLEVGKDLNLKILIIGDGPEMQSLQKISESLSIRVDFLGEISQTEVRKWMQKSRIFVQISSYEGLSFSLLQAMEAGVPCVISDIPGNAQVAQSGKEAIFVELNNKSKLRDSIHEVLVNSELAASLTNNARARISQTFNEEIQFRRIVQELLE